MADDLEEKSIERYPMPQSSEMRLPLARGVEMAFVRVAAGEFQMGGNKTKGAQVDGDELPQHRVHLDDYWIGKYPVTAVQFAVFVKEASYGNLQRPDLDLQIKTAHPVVKVTWYDATAFCEWASKVTGQKVCLPSEAQWEKAARGPATGEVNGRIYPWGNERPTSQLCNFNNNNNGTTPIGKYSPRGDSPYGCSDMAGNVWEWVEDWYDKNYYGQSPHENPSGPSAGEYRVIRGGSWSVEARRIRSFHRDGAPPDFMSNYFGFRCATSLISP